MKNSGYTLIELLTVTAIMVVITTIIAGIITSVLRATSKIKIANAVTQNGNYALSIISNIILSSTNITQVSGTPISDCTDSPPPGNSITLSRVDGGSTVIACTSLNGGPMTVASNSESLLDTSIVQVGTCSFTCTQVNSDNIADKYVPPLITISFSVQNHGTALFENKSTSSFNTSVSMRNYSP